MAESTEYPHIVREADGVLMIKQTRIPVAPFVFSLLQNSKLEEAVREATELYPPGYLDPAKVFSAIAFYYDHTKEAIKQLDTFPPEGFQKDALGNWIRKNG